MLTERYTSGREGREGSAAFWLEISASINLLPVPGPSCITGRLSNVHTVADHAPNSMLGITHLEEEGTGERLAAADANHGAWIKPELTEVAQQLRIAVPDSRHDG